MNRPAAARLGAYAFVVAVGAGGMWRVESTARKAQDAAEAVAAEAAERLEASCAAGDDTRALIRRMSRDAPLEVGEAIIEVAGADDEPPDPKVVDAFREAMKRRLEGIVNQLPARRWDPKTETCVDVPLDTGG